MISVKLLGIGKSQSRWRFNPQMLAEAKVCEYLKSQIEFFFETNDTPGVSPSLLWETFKAFLRGCIISYHTTQNKRRKAEQIELEKQIKQLDIENAA